MSRNSDTLQHISARQVFRTYWATLRSYHLHWVSLIFLMVSSGLFSVVQPLYYKRFFDILPAASADPNQGVLDLLNVIYIVLGLNVASWAVSRIASLINANFQTKMMAELRQQSFNYMIDHSYAFFANNFTGSLVQRVHRYARAFERLADQITWNITPLVVRVIGIFIVLFAISPFIASVLLVWVVIFLVCNYFFSRWKYKYQIERAAAETRTTGVLSDAITNQNTIQLFSRSKDEIEHFKSVTEAQAKITRFTWNLDAALDGTQSLLMIIAEFFLFYFALFYWQEGTATIGVFVLLQSYLIHLGGNLWGFSRVIRDFYESMADAKEMVEILETEYEIQDAPFAKPIQVTKGKIIFDHVSFGFQSERPLLRDVGIVIKAGERVAFVGPSGAGKSTLVRLLLRLYDVTSGAIKIDRQNIIGVTQVSLRNALSLVPQDPILFHRTLMENIRYGRPGASDEEVKQAARLAHCDEFIKELQHKYNTYVGERGIKLSGGERQRVAIARAILKNAPILVLDEATSSLDSHSEYLIQDALDNLMKGRTTIVIAHRLSTIRKMDRILVINDGNVIEEGTHDDLALRQGGLYAKLWSLQAGGFLPTS